MTTGALTRGWIEGGHGRATLPVSEVAPGVVVEGPAPAPTDEGRALHHGFHRARGGQS